jgi:asparagine synthetase B (glutamine-hydrolysing)
MVAPGNKVNVFCTIFESSLQDIAERTDPSTCCLILSGGIDTCAILQAASQIGMTFAAAVTVVTGDDSYTRWWLPLPQLWPSNLVNEKDPVEKKLKLCIQKLSSCDGMMHRNSLVMVAAFQKVAELEFINDVIVEDGADELFGGYSFTLKTEDSKEWKEKGDSMCATWMFATGALANMHSLKSHSPYMEPQMVEWSNENTQQSDCIGK